MRPLILVLSFTLFGCSQETKPSPDAYAHSNDPATLIAWLKEVPGYVPADLAEKMAAEPYAFRLYGDGRVLYRNDGFQQFECKLNAVELNQLVRDFIDSGFLGIDELSPGGENTGVIIADAGAFVIGLDMGGKKNELQASALKHLVRTYPDDGDLKICFDICERMRGFTHDRAKPAE